MINQLQEKYQLSLLLLLGSVAVMGVFPFVVIRFLDGNYIAAFIDLTLILGITSLVSYAHRSKKIRMVSAIIAIFINAGAIVIAVANGIESFLWIYPVLASTFVLVKPIEALCINAIAVLSFVAISDIFGTISLSSYLVTTLMLSMCVFVYASHGAKQFRLLEKLNTVDALTGAFNRRALSSDIAAALASAERNNSKQLLAILDFDYFKAVNDKYGHAVGDKILKDFVKITTAHIRKYDRLYRFGGEEFILLLCQVNEQHHSFIDQLRVAIKQALKTPDGESVTVSFGVAPWLSGTTADTWVQRADVALYRAKESGRDCVVFSAD